MQLVHMDNITPGMAVGEDVPAIEGNIPLVRKGTVLNSDIISLMRKNDVRFAFISADKTPARPSEGGSSPPGRIHMPVLKPTISKVLRQEALSGIEALFADASIGASDVHDSTATVLKNIDGIVDQLLESLDGQSIVSIMNLKSYDDYTFHHSLSVAVLSVAIAQQMGFSKEDLQRIGRSAIMHDVGKIAVPIEIINKPSRLAPDEFSTIKNHSASGHDYLAGAIKDPDVLAGVLHHHERFDGSGYPTGARGHDIHLWSRIISVADVYDALTSRRAYRNPVAPADAIEYLMGSVGKDFDYDIVESFLKKVDIYPIGCMVQLSNGKTAVVYNNENLLRPVVRILPTGEILDLYRDRNCMNIVITKLLDAESDLPVLAF